MIFDVLTFEITDEKLLLCNGQCFSVWGFNVVALFQLFQNVVGNIDPDVVLLDGDCQHLVQHGVDTIYGAYFEAALFQQIIVEALDIGAF